MNAQCYAKPSFYTTLDKTPVNTRFPPMAYNIRQNSREHLPPLPPGVNVAPYPTFSSTLTLGGGGRGESVHGVLSNVVFAAKIGYPLYRAAARQEIRVADVLPREAY